MSRVLEAIVRFILLACLAVTMGCAIGFCLRGCAHPKPVVHKVHLVDDISDEAVIGAAVSTR